MSSRTIAITRTRDLAEAAEKVAGDTPVSRLGPMIPLKDGSLMRAEVFKKLLGHPVVRAKEVRVATWRYKHAADAEAARDREEGRRLDSVMLKMANNAAAMG